MDASRSVFLTPIEYLKGIGPRRAEALRAEMGIFRVGDLLNFFPYRYIDKTQYYTVSQIRQADADVQIKGRLGRVSEVKQGGRTVRLTADFYDETGRVELVWFKGIPWVKKNLVAGESYVVFGRPALFAGRYSIPHPEMETLEQHRSSPLSALVPVYPSSEKLQKSGVTSRVIALAVASVMEAALEQVEETLPAPLREKWNLISRREALRAIHFPSSTDQLARARYRMKFEEFFFMQLTLLHRKVIRQGKLTGYVFDKLGEHFNTFYNHHLPFELTGAQKRVVREIRRDVATGYQMNRLVQGDVSSGKTMVALLSMLMALDNGYQACMMAPTEILATQHYHTLVRLLGGMPVRVALLTGSTRGAARREILEGIRSSEIDILVGTHALIEDTVVFSRLGLAVIDEQHRFGVAQRSRLWGKSGYAPHILVMTATPIPRTLAMSVYGDLDVSVIDELPAGRRPIRTYHRYESSRLAVFGFMSSEIQKGRQVYVVYPLIEESERSDYKNLMAGYDVLEEYFRAQGYHVGVVHGRMKAEDKDAAIAHFAAGETQILVSTTVIEVGVDIPNATVMVIESAERFGLAQLHQLRGRVGRGGEQSHCILMTGDKLGSDSRARIETMVRTTDGFEIAETDMRLRGYGDLMGLRQSGVSNLKIADLFKDAPILEQARRAAQDLLFDDPELTAAENAPVRQVYQGMMQGRALWSYIS